MAITPPVPYSPVLGARGPAQGLSPLPSVRPTPPDLSDPTRLLTEIASMVGAISQLVKGNPKLLTAARSMLSAVAEGNVFGQRKAAAPSLEPYMPPPAAPPLPTPPVQGQAPGQGASLASMTGAGVPPGVVGDLMRLLSGGMGG